MRRRSYLWPAVVCAIVALVVLLSAAPGGERAGLASSPAPGRGQAPPTHRGPVEAENHKPGTASWQSAELARGRGQPVDEETGAQAHQRVHRGQAAGASGAGSAAPAVPGGAAPAVPAGAAPAAAAA